MSVSNHSDRQSAGAVALLAGPTATGKTALAVELARRLGGEIISADSMQVYRGCPIGAAQPSPDETRGVPYHLVNCVAPADASWCAADWLAATLRLIDEIHARGRAVIIVGGTGLYFKALSEGLFEADGARRDPALRRALERAWDADRGEALFAELRRGDPEAATRLHPNDRVRVVRALEVLRATGEPIGEHQERGRRQYRSRIASWSPRAVRFVLCAGRRALYARIDRRVEEMLDAGFLAEVEALLALGADSSWPVMRALGYSQMARAARGEISLERAVEETQRQSRRYAKSQIVLFRKWPGAVWIDAEREMEKKAREMEIILAFCLNE